MRVLIGILAGLGSLVLFGFGAMVVYAIFQEYWGDDA